MFESSDRISVIMQCVNNELQLPARIAREVAYLQLCMICESIAIECVIVHGGLSEVQVRKLMDKYAADYIINNMKHAYDKFFPAPYDVTEIAPGQKHLEDSKLPHLTQDDLKKLYNQCGSILHRGKPNTIVDGEIIDHGWIKDVVHYAQMITNLLTCHAIVMQGHEKAIFIDLRHRSAFIADATD
jgi:hypothetical protein